MTDENPYASTDVTSVKLQAKHRWLHRFIILNVLLVGLPLVLVLAVWGVLAMNNVELSGSSGTVSLSGLLIPIAYLAIPNLVMIAIRRNATHH